MAQSKSYKNIKMFNNLLEDGQQRPNSNIATKLDRGGANTNKVAHINIDTAPTINSKDQLIQSQHNWPRQSDQQVDIMSKF